MVRGARCNFRLLGMTWSPIRGRFWNILGLKALFESKPQISLIMYEHLLEINIMFWRVLLICVSDLVNQIQTANYSYANSPSERLESLWGVYTIQQTSSKRPAIHMYFQYICWKFAGRLLDRVNTLLSTKYTRRSLQAIGRGDYANKHQTQRNVWRGYMYCVITLLLTSTVYVGNEVRRW